MSASWLSEIKGIPITATTIRVTMQATTATINRMKATDNQASPK
jgi:hypothetical protein